MIHMEADELLDLVNKDDQVVGTVMREYHHAHSDEFTVKGQYFRGTSCFLVNDQRQLWIPKRQPTRRVAPNGLDFSMAEHVQSGEGHLEGALRGLREELRIRASEEDLVAIGTHVFDDFGCLMSLYAYFTNHTPDFSITDYQYGSWMTSDEAEELIAQGEPFKSTLPYWLPVMREWLANE